MSSSLLIGSFKNKADKMRKEQDYKKLLRLQARLNKQSEQMIKMPVSLPPSTTIEQEVEMDINQMRNSILSRISSILGDSGAKRFVYRYLQASGELDYFFDNMDDFIKILRYDRPLNASYLFNIYTRWKQRRELQKDQMTGMGYGSLQPTIQTEVDRMGHDARQRVLNSGLTPTQMYRYIAEVEDAITQLDMGRLIKIAGGRL